ncbi:MAG: cysteine desulfurase [Myxococcales bacterium]|nr:cysteine desulfurase [Myxococcales bacterium]
MKEQRPVYMDNNSTTRVDPRVLEVMLPFFSDEFGNAASINHVYGMAATVAVEQARSEVAALLNVDPRSIVFTSGATESNNLALKGVMRATGTGAHLIVAASEHKAILDPARALERDGIEVTVVPVDSFGMVDPLTVANAIRPDTGLVSIMWANNEVGTINPVDEISEICRRRSIPLHSDAAQAVGKTEIDLARSPVDMVSLSGHKIYGPKGVGVLYVRRGTPRIRLEPLFHGGGHERGYRSGTLSVPLVVGLGAACRLAMEAMATESVVVRDLRDRLWAGIKSRVDGVRLNGHPERRLPGSLHVSFEGVNAEALLMQLKDVLAASTGSACTTAEREPSHVLLAMGVDEDLIESSVRFGLGRFNDTEEIDRAVEAIVEKVSQLRRIVTR